jgi:hypothetical protein
MTEERDPKDMGLGDLIGELVELRKTYIDRLVSEDHPRPEVWSKYGGITEYNEKINQEYQERRQTLIAELNKRGKQLSGLLKNQ